jgi:hypothetical protein
MVVPVFGLLANFGCMLFYLLGPIPGIGVAGMSWKEPYIALGASLLWIIAGGVFLAMNSKTKGKEIILTSKPQTA